MVSLLAIVSVVGTNGHINYPDAHNNHYDEARAQLKSVFASHNRVQSSPLAATHHDD